MCRLGLATVRTTTQAACGGVAPRACHRKENRRTESLIRGWWLFAIKSSISRPQVPGRVVEPICARSSISTTGQIGVSEAPSFGYMHFRPCPRSASRILQAAKKLMDLGSRHMDRDDGFLAGLATAYQMRSYPRVGVGFGEAALAGRPQRAGSATVLPDTPTLIECSPFSLARGVPSAARTRVFLSGPIAQGRHGWRAAWYLRGPACCWIPDFY